MRFHINIVCVILYMSQSQEYDEMIVEDQFDGW